MYQQAFSANSLASVRDYEWVIPRVMKSKPTNRFLIKLTNIQASTNTTNDSSIIYMYHPELTGRSNTQVVTTTSTINNKCLLTVVYSTSLTSANINQQNNLLFLVDNIPTTPILLNMESGTAAAPTGTKIMFAVQLIIYEIEGDIATSLNIL